MPPFRFRYKSGKRDDETGNWETCGWYRSLAQKACHQQSTTPTMSSSSSDDPVREIARRARLCSHVMASTSHAARNGALQRVKQVLTDRRESVLEANDQDVAAATEASLPSPILKRLGLRGDKYRALLEGIDDVCGLPDPVGQCSLARELDEGLELYRVSCPIGVLCIIFESRPDAAVQIASLAIKSGNVVILKGGREAARSNEALVEVFQAALEAEGLPREAVHLVSTREQVSSPW